MGKEYIALKRTILALISSCEGSPSSGGDVSGASSPPLSEISTVTHPRPPEEVSLLDRFVESLMFWRVPTKVSDRQLSLERDARELVRIVEQSCGAQLDLMHHRFRREFLPTPFLRVHRGHLRPSCKLSKREFMTSSTG